MKVYTYAHIHMIFPIRCFTCGNPIATKYDEYKKLSNTTDFKNVMKLLDIERQCCKRMFITYKDVGIHMCTYQFKDTGDTTSSFNCINNNIRTVNCD